MSRVVSVDFVWLQHQVLCQLGPCPSVEQDIGLWYMQLATLCTESALQADPVFEFLKFPQAAVTHKLTKLIISCRVALYGCSMAATTFLQMSDRPSHMFLSWMTPPGSLSMVGSCPCAFLQFWKCTFHSNDHAFLHFWSAHPCSRW